MGCGDTEGAPAQLPHGTAQPREWDGNITPAMSHSGLVVSPPAMSPLVVSPPPCPPRGVLTTPLPHPQQGGGEGQHGEQEQRCQHQAQHKQQRVLRGHCPCGWGHLGWGRERSQLVTPHSR